MLIPSSRPERSTSGPPELPGLIAASVWSSPVSFPFSPSIVRWSPEMIPEVTVAPRPRGKPTAKTASPSRSDEERARGSGTRSVARTRMTARSFSGAVPITVPAIGRLCTSSLKTTVTRVVPSTTWLFVRMIPRRSSTIPEPSPRPPPKDSVRTFTTDGRTRATASASEPARSGAAAVLVSVEVGSVTVTVCAAVERRRGALVVPAAAGERYRREQRPATNLTAASGRSRLRSRPRRAAGRARRRETRT